MTDSHLRSYAYGGSGRQHDSGEFLNFLLEILNDELNPRRNIRPPPDWTPEQEKFLNEAPVVQASEFAWKTYTTDEDSLITRRMKGQIAAVITCDKCRKSIQTFITFAFLSIPISPSNEVQSLDALIRDEFGTPKPITGYNCPRCNEKNVTAQRTDFLAVLPDFLILQILRYDAFGAKIQTPIAFTETGINMTPACLRPETDTPGQADRRRMRPFNYDCYGAIMHQGTTPAHGHYYTIAKNLDKTGQGSGQWHKFNDKVVTPTTFKEVQGRLTANILLKRQGAPPA